jgi:hypothetical protein
MIMKRELRSLDESDEVQQISQDDTKEEEQERQEWLDKEADKKRKESGGALGDEEINKLIKKSALGKSSREAADNAENATDGLEGSLNQGEPVLGSDNGAKAEEDDDLEKLQAAAEKLFEVNDEDKKEVAAAPAREMIGGPTSTEELERLHPELKELWMKDRNAYWKRFIELRGQLTSEAGSEDKADAEKKLEVAKEVQSEAGSEVEAADASTNLEAAKTVQLEAGQDAQAVADQVDSRRQAGFSTFMRVVRGIAYTATAAGTLGVLVGCGGGDNKENNPRNANTKYEAPEAGDLESAKKSGNAILENAQKQKGAKAERLKGQIGELEEALKGDNEKEIRRTTARLKGALDVLKDLPEAEPKKKTPEDIAKEKEEKKEETAKKEQEKYKKPAEEKLEPIKKQNEILKDLVKNIKSDTTERTDAVKRDSVKEAPKTLPLQRIGDKIDRAVKQWQAMDKASRNPQLRRHTDTAKAADTLLTDARAELVDAIEEWRNLVILEKEKATDALPTYLKALNAKVAKASGDLNKIPDKSKERVKEIGAEVSKIDIQLRNWMDGQLIIDDVTYAEVEKKAKELKDKDRRALDKRAEELKAADEKAVRPVKSDIEYYRIALRERPLRPDKIYHAFAEEALGVPEKTKEKVKQLRASRAALVREARERKLGGLRDSDFLDYANARVDQAKAEADYNAVRAKSMMAIPPRPLPALPK